MKRALIIHPNNFYNIGDRITFLGAKALLTKAVGDPKKLDVVQFDMKRALAELDTYVSQYNWGDVDIIALAGSPWIWNTCERTPKYKLIYDAIKRYPNAKKIALGVGSCFSYTTYHNIRYGKNDIYFFNAPERKLILHQLYDKFDYILVRDKFAQWLLEQCNIDSNYTYDTSAYSYKYIQRRNIQGKKKVLFFYDPSKGVSKQSLGCDADEYISYQIDWAKKNKADIYCNCCGGKSTLDKRGVKGTFTVDLDFMSKKFTEYDEMLTGRIHMGVLGFISGIRNITTLPVDTRFMTTLKFGMKPKFIGDEWKYDKEVVEKRIWNDIYKEEQKITNSLRKIIYE